VAGERRPYTKKARADAEQATRLRITESAVALHGSVGPARTSISAIAEHAGVRRSTVYRHFADEAAIFDACTAHWGAQNPIPDLSDALAIPEPAERLRAVLEALYTFYRGGEQMLANLLRDEDSVQIVRERLGVYHDFLDGLRDPLLTGRALRGATRRRAHAAIGHVLAFGTWRSLAREQGLSDLEAVELMTAMVDAAA
jgi:AcrR family transcriptional regulator